MLQLLPRKTQISLLSAGEESISTFPPAKSFTSLMGRIFLSHNHLDKPFVRMLKTDIEASGIRIWLDEVELKVGDSLILRMAEAIDKADYVVAFLSRNSIKSNWVKKELAIATSLGINGNRVKVLPLLLGEIQDQDIPAFLVDQLYADFRQPGQYDLSLRELLRRLKPRAVPEKILVIDAYRKDQLVLNAGNPLMRNWVIDYLVEMVPQRVDPTERYWGYVALREIGGDKAERALQKGLSDDNTFARLGT